MANTVKEYGTPDPDDSAYKVLLELVGHLPVKYIMHYPRIPVDARMCQMPGSVKVVALLEDNTTITVRQDRPGSQPRRI